MGNGFLAIWSDLDPVAETDYLHWMAREHAKERVGIAGFVSMRMFRALDAVTHRYFILYELRDAGVVNSSDYLARLNQPTAWSRRMMPQLGNFVRGGGEVTAIFGLGRGGFVAALRLGADAIPDADRIAEEIALRDRIASVRVLVTDYARTSVKTREKGMRAGDRSFDGLLVIEGLDAASVRAAIVALPPERSQAADLAVYETIFSLDKTCI
jgi:hypothetical protein